MIDITLLGTAALLPLPDRALTAAALTCCGRTVLLDCGEGTQTAARRAGVNLMSADVIALTHYHGDHCFGLPGLMQTMLCMNRASPLLIVGPGDIKRELAPIMQLAGGLSYPVWLEEMPREGLALRQRFPGWPPEARLSAFPTQHRVPSQGYVFTLGRPPLFLPDRARALGVPVQQWKALQHGQPVEAGGRVVQPREVQGPERKGLKFVFSGDTAACDSLTAAARGADLLISEATYGENGQAQLASEQGHMNFAQAARTAAQAGVQRLWLAHFSQQMEEPEAFLCNAQAHFPQAECGQDGMKLTLRFSQEPIDKVDNS